MRKDRGGRSQDRLNFSDWRKAVNQRLKGVYAISLRDVGMDDSYLKPHWQMQQSPNEFVEWYANRANLDPLPPSLQEK
jgi:hypothetical protein